MIDNAEVQLTESLIKELHRILKTGTQDASLSWFNVGDYKTRANTVGGMKTVAPERVADAVQSLLKKYGTAAHSLEDIVEFHYEFECIHPFQDGNGRLSRALTMLLLMRAGYVYAPYSSLESIIEASKQNYYVSLRATQKTLHEKEPNWNVWIVYFLNALAKQVRSLKIKVEEEHLLRAMPEISMRIFEAVKAHGSLSISETEGLLRINKFTLRAHFKRLTDEGLLMRIGRGRSTKYAIRHG